MRTRALVAAVLVAAGLGVITSGTASAASSASVGPVTCADGQGSVTLTLTADGGRDTGFLYDVQGDTFSDYFLEDQVVVPAGESTSIPVADLDDGEYRVMVFSEEPDVDFAEVLDETITVACDPAPEGPYTNAKAAIDQGCADQATVHAANRPIGGNVEDLQPVTFAFLLTQGEQDTVLAEFVLPDEADDPYTHSVTVDLTAFGISDPSDDGTGTGGDPGTDPEEPGDDGAEGGDGEEPGEPRIAEDELTLSVTADGTELRRQPLSFCVASPSSGEGGPAVVNTGA